jgi:hypothetical protein
MVARTTAPEPQAGRGVAPQVAGPEVQLGPISVTVTCGVIKLPATVPATLAMPPLAFNVTVGVIVSGVAKFTSVRVITNVVGLEYPLPDALTVKPVIAPAGKGLWAQFATPK